MLIDTHCHLHDREFFTEGQALLMLKNADKNDVKQVICIGTNHEDSMNARDFAKEHENVFWTYGVHPEYAENFQFKDPFSEINSQNLPVAIGEVGLDYHYQPYDRGAQIKLLEQMLQLAKDHDLSLSFHVREAFDDFFAVIENFPDIRGVVHSFSDSPENLAKAIKKDFYIGVNGLATFTSIPIPPLERTLLETDAPFLTPEPNRGKINEPGYVKHIAQYLSNKTGVSLAEIAEKTTQNARRIFRI